jgi:hypothetical protein
MISLVISSHYHHRSERESRLGPRDALRATSVRVNGVAIATACVVRIPCDDVVVDDDDADDAAAGALLSSN